MCRYFHLKPYSEFSCNRNWPIQTEFKPNTTRGKMLLDINQSDLNPTSSKKSQPDPMQDSPSLYRGLLNLGNK